MVGYRLAVALTGLVTINQHVDASSKHATKIECGSKDQCVQLMDDMWAKDKMKPPKPQGAVVNGCEVSANEARFYAQLISCDSDGTGCSLCGGSWVSTTRILTAAHCVIDKPKIYVFTNDDNLFPPGTRYNYYVTDKVIHNWYNDGDIGHGYDIAMLKLSKWDTPYSHYIEMAGMGDFNARKHDDPMIAYGTGTTATGASSSDTLLETYPMGFLPCSEMRSWELWRDGHHKTTYNLQVSSPTDKFVCVNATESPNNGFYGSICQGDSGGPLVYHGKLYGVTSYNHPPCQDFLPAVFNNVAYFKDVDSFIRNNMETGIPTSGFVHVPQGEDGENCNNHYGNHDGEVQEPSSSCDGPVTFDQNFVHEDYTIRPFGESTVPVNMCLVSNGGKVKVADCRSEDGLSRWYYNSWTKQIKNKSDKLCWTANSNRAEIQAITMKSCENSNALQKFIQINGRIHLNTNTQICASFAPGNFQKFHASNFNYKLDLMTRPCNPQLFGEDNMSADGCDSDSTIELDTLVNKQQQIRGLKDEHSHGTCLWKGGDFAKVGKCKSTNAFKLGYVEAEGKVMRGVNCLTAFSTGKGGVATFEKCSETPSIKQRQQWSWTDGRLALWKTPRMVLQYNFLNTYEGKTVKARTAWALTDVFGNPFSNS